jgi:hypothetical protein
MTKPTTYIQAPERFIAGRTADGRTIYHTLRWCNSVVRQFNFTLSTEGINGEARYELSQHIDVRDVPEEFLPLDLHNGMATGRWDEKGPPVQWLINALNTGWTPPAYGHGRFTGNEF